MRYILTQDKAVIVSKYEALNKSSELKIEFDNAEAGLTLIVNASDNRSYYTLDSNYTAHVPVNILDNTVGITLTNLRGKTWYCESLLCAQTKEQVFIFPARNDYNALMLNKLQIELDNADKKLKDYKRRIEVLEHFMSEVKDGYDIT